MKRLQKINGQLKSDFQQISRGILFKKTIVISGGSRGIGLAIAKRCAQDGANIVILAKTVQEHPKLPGTIFTAAKQIQEAGGTALPLKCDIRNEKQVQWCISQVVKTFGGIDILINNASAINLSSTQKVQMKRYDLMHQINIRGTFLLSKTCYPYLKKSQNPHILTISPPLVLQKQKFKQHLAYSLSKIGMSMCVFGMSEEFRDDKIAVNALWPKKSIATATIKNFFGGQERLKTCRKDTIMGDSAYLILTKNSCNFTGKFYTDEQILRQNGILDFSKYLVDQKDIQKLRSQ